MFRLALRLGKTLGEIGKMPASELFEWMAFFNLVPHGERDDYRTALICDTVWKSAGGKGSSVKKFMPKRNVPETQSIKEQIAAFKGLTDG